MAVRVVVIRLTQLLDIVGRHTKEENVIVTDWVVNFNVGTVKSFAREVKAPLAILTPHVRSPRRCPPAKEICSDKLAARIINSASGNSIVF